MALVDDGKLKIECRPPFLSPHPPQTFGFLISESFEFFEYIAGKLFIKARPKKCR
jgi:hypothetical protein